MLRILKSRTIALLGGALLLIPCGTFGSAWGSYANTSPSWTIRSTNGDTLNCPNSPICTFIHANETCVSQAPIVYITCTDTDTGQQVNYPFCSTVTISGQGLPTGNCFTNQ